jgi:hypothetical protein
VLTCVSAISWTVAFVTIEVARATAVRAERSQPSFLFSGMGEGSVFALSGVHATQNIWWLGSPPATSA